MTTNDANATGPLSWVLGPSELRNLIEQCRTALEVVVDLETTGLDEYATTGGQSNGGVAARIALAAFTLPQPDDTGYWDGNDPVTYVLPLSHPHSPFSGTWRSTLKKVIQEGVLEAGRPLVNQNIKFDARWIYAHTGLDVSHLVVWDTQVSSHLLDETQSTRLKERVPATFDGVERWDDFDLSTPGAAERVPLIELGEYACLAEGQPVITDRGLVPIEQVQPSDLLWDGVEWVRHEGVVFKGTRDIISHDNLRATPDHLVLTDTGEWACLSSIATGARRAASVARPRFTSSIPRPHRQHSSRAAAPAGRSDVLSLPADLLEAGQRLAARSRRLSLPVGSQVRGASVRRGLPSAIQRNGAALPYESTLLRERGRSQVRVGFGVYPLGLGGVQGDRPVWPGVRQNRQRRALRAEQPSPRHDEGQFLEQAKHRECAVHGAAGCSQAPLASREDGSSRLSYRTGGARAEASAGYDGGAGALGAVQDYVRVYDILNAGPRYRFAVPGLIVSNCRDTWWTWRLRQQHALEMFLPGGGYPEAIIHPSDPEAAEDYVTAQLGRVARWVGMPTVASLTRMEQNGIRLDVGWTKARLAEQLERAEKGLDALAARYGQDRSRATTAATALWFKALTARAVELDELRVLSTTGQGNAQWNKAVLGKLARKGYTLAQEILDQRDATKQSQFLASWLEYTRSDGKIHTRYNVGRVATGRLSSSEPNMQQVSKKLRQAFIPSDGHVIADFDFSQIELRVAAFIARCEPMIQAFQEGQDLHRLLGSYITGKPPEEVTAEDRQRAKAANFGLLYLQSAAGFRDYAEDTYGVLLTEQEAVEMHAAFFARWPGMAEWHARTISRVQRDGYIISPIGRVRRLPNIWSPNTYLSGEAERQAVNSPVQGLASDLMQMAAADIQGLLPGTTPVPGVRLVATVHDSIVAELPVATWREAADEVARRMERSGEWLTKLGVTFDVPIVADYAVGTRWSLSDVSHPED